MSFLLNLDPTPEGRNAGSRSSAGLANTYFWIDPLARVGGLIMTQVLPFAAPAVLKAYRAVERAILRRTRRRQSGLRGAPQG